MSRPRDCCPHCHKRRCFDTVCVDNCTHYANATHKMMCVHCGKPVTVTLERTVRLVRVEAGRHTSSDYGGGR